MPKVRKCNTGLTHSFVFQSFVKRINRVNAERAQGAEHASRNEEGAELQPVV